MANEVSYLEVNTPSGVKKVAAIHDTVTDVYYQWIGDPDMKINTDTQSFLHRGAIGAWTNLMTAQLNALAAGSHTALSTTQPDNSYASDTNPTPPTLVDFELSLSAMSGAPVYGAEVALYLLPQNSDGVNFPVNAVSPGILPSPMYKVGSFYLPAQAAAGCLHVMDVPLPPSKWGVVVENLSAVNMAATGNVLKYRTHF
jgi:hypothetical protein